MLPNTHFHLSINKDENVRRYAVRGKKRDRETENRKLYEKQRDRYTVRGEKRERERYT